MNKTKIFIILLVLLAFFNLPSYAEWQIDARVKSNGDVVVVTGTVNSQTEQKIQ